MRSCKAIVALFWLTFATDALAFAKAEQAFPDSDLEASEKDTIHLEWLVETMEVVKQVQLKTLLIILNRKAEYYDQRLGEAGCVFGACCAFRDLLAKVISEKICDEGLKEHLRGIEFKLIKALDHDDIQNIANLSRVYDIEMFGLQVLDNYQKLLTSSCEALQNLAQLQKSRDNSPQEKIIPCDREEKAMASQSTHSEHYYPRGSILGLAPNHRFFSKMLAGLNEHIDKIQKLFDQSSFATMKEPGPPLRTQIIFNITGIENANGVKAKLFKFSYKVKGDFTVELISSIDHRTVGSFCTGDLEILFNTDLRNGFNYYKNPLLIDAIFDLIYWKIPAMKKKAHEELRALHRPQPIFASESIEPWRREHLSDDFYTPDSGEKDPLLQRQK